MFGVLVESNPGPRRRREVVVASAMAHAALALLAVWATAEGGSRDGPAIVMARDAVRPLYTQPAPDAADRARGPAAPTNGVSSPEQASPQLPQVGSIDVPDVLPTAAAPLGMPDADLLSRSRVTGDRAGVGVPRPGPGGVLDNLVAEKPAIPLEGNVQPVYPDALRSAGIEGEVEVEFVIDASGRVRPGSFRVLRSDHARFTSSVREAVATHRFLPAEVRGTRVAVLVRQRFVFSLGA